MRTYVLLILILGLLMFGCVGTSISDIKCQIRFNEHGSGNASIIFHSTSDLTKELPKYFYNRHNVQYAKAGDVYYVDFDLVVGDITDFSRFTPLTINNVTTYTYKDKLSFNLLTDNDATVPDFEYCVQMPPGSKITSLRFDGFDYPDAVGKDNYCVMVDGSSSNYGQDLTIVSEYRPTGCKYDNPRCGTNYDCINNVCVLKDGCQYNNPSCDENHSCVNNNCILKAGCKYKNPPCESDYDCINNNCVLKSGCNYANPTCDENHICIDNTCVLKPGCRYNNPACDENHTCVNDICTLKSGCRYNNPPCSNWYEYCSKENNACGINIIDWILDQFR